MTLAKVFKTIGNGFSSEIREFKSIMRRLRLTADNSPLGANFRKFGASFNTYDYDAFVDKAREFFKAADDSKDPLYTFVDMPGNRMAIDYNGEIRGVFTLKGKPLAFFRPDYMQFGYVSKSAELADFKNGNSALLR